MKLRIFLIASLSLAFLLLAIQSLQAEPPCGWTQIATLNIDGNSSDFDDDSIPSDDGLDISIPTANADGIEIENDQELKSMPNAVADACIICYDNSIDCVMTPCGHQICCLECSENLNACPVCNTQGQFIRIFKP